MTGFVVYLLQEMPLLLQCSVGVQCFVLLLC